MFTLGFISAHPEEVLALGLYDDGLNFMKHQWMHRAATAIHAPGNCKAGTQDDVYKKSKSGGGTQGKNLYIPLRDIRLMLREGDVTSGLVLDENTFRKGVE